MEPGHEDREYVGQNLLVDLHDMPQWSPVMKTGNTGGSWITQPSGCAASMEPGHEDREYIKDIAATPVRFVVPQWSPVMKTGNTGPLVCPRPGRHRKPQWSPVMKTGNTRKQLAIRRRRTGLNGARS